MINVFLDPPSIDLQLFTCMLVLKTEIYILHLIYQLAVISSFKKRICVQDFLNTYWYFLEAISLSLCMVTTARCRTIGVILILITVLIVALKLASVFTFLHSNPPKPLRKEETK